jgi:predicted transposase YdaD
VPGPFDTTTKHLFDADPAGWLRLAGLTPTGQVEPVEVDLATIGLTPDKVARVEAARPWLAQVEFQSSYERTLPDRLLAYSVLLRYRYQLPVRSILLLLRPAAAGPAVSGLLQHRQSDEDAYLEFRYQVVRVWERSPDEVLASGLWTLPLLPISAVRPDQLPDLVRTISRRIEEEASADDARTLWTATYILMGLRYDEALTRQLLREVRAMRESVTYQSILAEGRAEGRVEGRLEGREEGRAEEARALLLRLGTRRFGPLSPEERAMLAALEQPEALETLADRLLDVASWQELLASD